jgi:serpin B
VKQKTYIDVNEEGTEAAGATSVEVVTESASLDGPFHMEVNRPFFIAITDNNSGTILFIGLISNPQ